MPARLPAPRVLLSRARRRLRALVIGAPALGSKVGAWAQQSWAALRTDPAARDRALGRTVFAAIFGFFVVSVDYLITGGPDWNPGAAPAPRVTAQNRVEATVFTPAFAPPPVLQTASLEAGDYSLTTETLLGGPEMILASAEGAGGARPVETVYTPMAQIEPDAKLKGVAAVISVSASAALW